MKFLFFNDLAQTRLNLQNIVAYNSDSDTNGWYIVVVYTGGVAISSTSYNFKEPTIYLKYATKESRDNDLETLDDICVHEK